ncbi:hypothetical protein [Streptomyces sp. NPDC055632]
MTSGFSGFGYEVVEPLKPSPRITARYLFHDETENRESPDSPGGTPSPPPLLGDRCRALAGVYLDPVLVRWSVSGAVARLPRECATLAAAAVPTHPSRKRLVGLKEEGGMVREVKVLSAMIRRRYRECAGIAVVARDLGVSKFHRAASPQPGGEAVREGPTRAGRAPL